MLRNKRLYQELINFDNVDVETTSEIHAQFSEWFIYKFLDKINEKIIRNIEENMVRTYIRVRLPQRILNRYKITKKYTGARNRYRLPATVCSKIKAYWNDKGWSLHVCDDSPYVKKSNTILHDVSERNHRLSLNYVIILASYTNTGDQ